MSVSFLTIVLFFIYMWGLGFTASYFLPKPSRWLERFFVNVGLGLGIFPILAIIINAIHVPLDWRLFLFLSLIFPAIIFAKKAKSNNFKFTFPKISLTKSDAALLVALLIFAVSFYTYTTGAFSYPYLEDEDPWGHALGVKYVALEKNAYDPAVMVADTPVDPVLSYIDPYPPAYDVLMGILHQTSPDLTWTLKFFNALIISLGFIFFYLFANLLIENRGKALFATFVLASVPAYLSHFIWAHSLVITIFFPTMYAFIQAVRSDEKEGWWIVALILVASIWVSQNLEQPIKLTSMLIIYLVLVSIIHKKFFYRCYAALAGGIALSFVWWGVMIQKYTLRGFITYYAGAGASASDGALAATGGSFINSVITKLGAVLDKITSAGGSGSRIYHIQDFIFTKPDNMINNPIGIGFVVSLLAIIGLIYALFKYRSRLMTEKNTWLAVSLFWLVFTYWGVNGQGFPISVAKAPFRIWMILAIAVALVAAEGFSSVVNFFSSQKVLKAAAAIVLIGLVLFTSASDKYAVNTAVWPTSGSFSPQEAYEYGQWFKSIPLNTPVFLYSPRDKLTIGYGGYSCAWCQDVIDFREDFPQNDADQLYDFLKEHKYEYLVVNPRMDLSYAQSSFGNDGAQQLLQQRYDEMLAKQPFLQPVYQQKDGFFLVFKVN
ncbi:hypothetical protein COV20_03890 [Candidatus Woesearchaeota archaeon CG10_big_fil_rev_8_21_14_0_10_45_16]|nr:MAG: hypothetical protein COV20_03890 [Candidatus Woesearchaeota archaeon CG10_big_fil_rev_8_21_14_0_10_45_16]